jgi:hypothetical protein
MHQGKVNPYILSVGMPGGLNFSYDMSTCNLINAWQGKFIDVSNMWTERGESQLEIPLGPLVEFERGVSIARLADSSIPFPELVMAEDNPLSQRRYRLNEKGVPVFQYQFVEASVEDFVCVSNDRSGITREVQVETKSPARDLYILIAKGNAIERLANGAYAINDKEYYVESIKGVNEQRLVITKNKSGQYQLLLPLNPDDKTLQFNYTIVW